MKIWSKIISELLKPGDTALDIGAHEGNFSKLLLDRVGENGKVLAFEPHPMKYQILSKRYASLPQIQAFNFAVSDKSGFANFYFGDAQHADQASTLLEEFATKERLGEDFRSIQVKTETIDEFAKNSENFFPAFIKVDVEGAEAQVFRGAINTIQRFRPHIFFEFGAADGKPIPQSAELLSDLGYRMAFADIHHFCDPKKLSWSPGDYKSTPDNATFLIEADHTKFRSHSFVGNLIAVPKESWQDCLGAFDIFSFTEGLDRLLDPWAKGSTNNIQSDDLLKRLKKKVPLPLKEVYWRARSTFGL